MKFSSVFPLLTRTVLLTFVILFVGFLSLSQEKVIRENAQIHFESQQLLLQQARVLLVSSNRLDVVNSDYTQTLTTIYSQLDSTLNTLTETSQKPTQWYSVTAWRTRTLQKKTRAHIQSFSQAVTTLKEIDEVQQKILAYSLENDIGKLNPKTQIGEVERRIDAAIQGLASISEKQESTRPHIERIQQSLKDLKLKVPPASKEFLVEIRSIEKDIILLKTELKKARSQHVVSIFTPLLVEQSEIIQEHEKVLLRLR